MHSKNCFSWPASLLRVFVVTTVALACFSCSRQPTYAPANQQGTDVVIDPSALAPDVPKFFTYPYRNKRINFFALKIDNTVTAFFDACASCNGHREGYRYEDGAVVCRYCNIRFPVYKLEKGLGSCYPIKIEGRMENGKYRIPAAMLEKEADKF